MTSQDHGDTTAERANTIALLIEVFNDTKDRKLRKSRSIHRGNRAKPQS